MYLILTLRYGADRVAKRTNSDEYYIISLIEEYLGLTAERQATFDFLRGDPNPKNNRQGRKLNVDAYFPTLKLAVEFNERQHSEPVKHFDKPHKMTISGVHRGKQRDIYDQRRKKLLPKNGIILQILDYREFELRRKKLIRTENDKYVIEEKFKSWKKNCY